MRCKVLQPGAHDRSINDLLEFKNCNAVKSCVTRQPLILNLKLISEASEFFKFLFFNLFLQQTSLVVEFAYPL